jgi:DNA mismatch endonuclease (patch repair protein)
MATAKRSPRKSERGWDIYSPEKRSEIMRKVRGKDTALERTVRSIVHRLGFRFRLHVAGLPGRPDIALPRHRKVIFVNGCFWHQHRGCPRSKLPRTRATWWRRKLERNVVRDRQARRRLRSMGWRTLVVWECRANDLRSTERRLRAFLAHDGS